MTLRQHPPVLLEDLPPNVATIGAYHDDWIYPLLPIQHNPSMDDFPRIWQRFGVHSHDTNNLKIPPSEPDPTIIDKVVNEIREHLPEQLELLQAGKYSQQDIVSYVLNQITTVASGLVVRIPNPAEYPQRKTRESLTLLLRNFPDLRIPAQGCRCLSNDKIRFKTPAVSYDSGVQIPDLKTYKRDLSWHLQLETQKRLQCTNYELYHGQVLIYSNLPFTSTDGLNFTHHPQEIAFIKRLQMPPRRQQKHTSTAKKEEKEIRDFMKWVQTCASRARKTMNAVAQGWFPQIPINVNNKPQD